MDKNSAYEIIRRKVSEKKKELQESSLNINQTIRNLREKKKMSGADLCRKAGDLDPKTLTALEKGRIRNPSIQTLESVARGLEMSVSDLFRAAELKIESKYYQGTQKGCFQMEFQQMGLKIVSFTPLIHDFFCGKFILSPKKTLSPLAFKQQIPMYVATMIGKFEVLLEEDSFPLKEGDSLFFNASFKHSFHNPQHRDSVLLVVTTPSFLMANDH